MSDSCNAMRGAKSGTVTRLKNEEFTNLVDLGGCSLHHVANAAKHACSAAELGDKVEALVKEFIVISSSRKWNKVTLTN